MPFASVEAFVAVLRQFRLLDPEQLNELTHPPQNTLVEPPLLARELVRRGWLTPFQVNHLFLGRGADLLLGSYVLLDKLGEGGMGQVFKANNWKLGKTGALKVIRPEQLPHPDAVRRFRREILAVAQLDHVNVVRAYDADEVAGILLFVMEFVPGTDLRKLVKKSGPLPVELACEYTRQAALGLAHAHEHGLVHRDIKPSNFLLRSASENRWPTPGAPTGRAAALAAGECQRRRRAGGPRDSVPVPAAAQFAARGFA